MAAIPSVTLNNGLQMPQLGLGVYLMPPEVTADNVNVALASGYRLIDTAAAYGNEREVGVGIRSSSVPRAELFITTKVWNQDQGYDRTLTAFDTSMTQLGLEYLDLYLIHWPRSGGQRLLDTWRALEELYDEGRVRAIGVCNFKPHHLDELMAATEVVPAVLQIELHPLFTQAEVRQYARKHHIQVESWYPLGGQQGIHTLLQQPLLTSLAVKYQKTPAQIVLRWHTQLGLVVIPKSSHPARIHENRNIFDFELTPAEVDALSALDTGRRLGPDPDTYDQ